MNSMYSLIKLFLVLPFWRSVYSNPFDDGKYTPKKYGDGKYYRPLTEGKYIHDDAGRYTYIYRQGPDGIYRYIHQIGPNGGNGGDGGQGPDGPGGPKTINDFAKYAKKYPYFNKIFTSFIDEYVTPDFTGYGDQTGANTKLGKLAVKCDYLDGTQNHIGILREYPPQILLRNGEVSGSHYIFNGTKYISNLSRSSQRKLKIDYEVHLKIVEVDDSNDQKDIIQKHKILDQLKLSNDKEIEKRLSEVNENINEQKKNEELEQVFQINTENFEKNEKVYPTKVENLMVKDLIPELIQSTTESILATIENLEKSEKVFSTNVENFKVKDSIPELIQSSTESILTTIENFEKNEKVFSTNVVSFKVKDSIPELIHSTTESILTTIDSL